MTDADRTLPPDSPLNELWLLREYIERGPEDGLSLENWRKVENALDRVARIVAAADKWAAAYASAKAGQQSDAPVEKWLFEAVRGYHEIGVPYRTEWGTTEAILFEDPPIGPEDWEFFA